MWIWPQSRRLTLSFTYIGAEFPWQKALVKLTNICSSPHSSTSTWIRHGNDGRQSFHMNGVALSPGTSHLFCSHHVFTFHCCWKKFNWSLILLQQCCILGTSCLQILDHSTEAMSRFRQHLKILAIGWFLTFLLDNNVRLDVARFHF